MRGSSRSRPPDWRSSPHRPGRTSSTATGAPPDGRTFSIRGPAITTPGGNQTEGDYSRHHFSYVVPDGEQSAGDTVAMILLNENTVNVEEGGKAEIWVRCKPAIS